MSIVKLEQQIANAHVFGIITSYKPKNKQKVSQVILLLIHKSLQVCHYFLCYLIIWPLMYICKVIDKLCIILKKKHDKYQNLKVNINF